jgi:hypothetical protein
MSAPEPPNGSYRPQSALSEAVEQAADAASIWCRDVAQLAIRQADRLASGGYGLDDLVTGQVDLLRIWVKNSIGVAGALSDNLALLAYWQAAGPAPPRYFDVGVRLPAGGGGQLQSSDLEGQRLGYRIPASRVRLAPAAVPAQAEPSELTVEVAVSCADAPLDIYAGVLSFTDGTVVARLRVAIDELGGLPGLT